MGKLAKDETLAKSVDAQLRIARAIEALDTSGNVCPEWDEEAGEFTVESIKRWLNANCDGKVYSVDETLDGTQALTKTGANADVAVPTPATLAAPGSDPYRELGPFRWEHVNASVDDDGTIHITGMKSFGNFSYTDGRDVFALAPVRYVSHAMVGGKYRIAVSDRPHVGMLPEERSLRPDGTLMPFMLRAAFAASKDSDGKPRSVAGAKLWNFDCSHNSMQSACKKKGKWYSGYTQADWDYLYECFILKYANKSSQAVYSGCTGHSEQGPVTVAGTAVATVTVAKATAQYWPVGSAVEVGTQTGKAPDRNDAKARDIAQQANIVAKAVDGDNVVLTLDCGPITTEVGQYVSTAPWNPGACRDLATDGSPYDPKSGREPCMVQGIEVMLGAYEILGDALAKGTAEDGWGLYLVDTTKASTDVTADYRKVYSFPDKASDGESYPTAMVKSEGALVPQAYGASTSLGVGDGIWYHGKSTTGTRQVLVFGILGDWAYAGFRRALLGNWPDWAWWVNASRVSIDGPNGVNPAELPQAA